MQTTVVSKNLTVIRRFSKAAFDEQERAEIAKANASIGHIEITSKDTRSNVCGRIKGQFNTYCQRRNNREILADLLHKIIYNVTLYSRIVPGFLGEQPTTFPAIQRAVAALPPPKVQSSKAATKGSPPAYVDAA